MRSNTLCVVSSGKLKIWDKQPDYGPVRVRDMYIGIFSKKCIEYAEKLYPYSWRILSAEYGFMKGDDIVPAPYEACFHNKNSKPISVDELKIQAEDDALKEYNKIIVLGGKYYTNLIKSIFPHKYVYNPLEGCKGIGYMISRLNKAIKY